MTPIATSGRYSITFEALPESISMREHFIQECGWTEYQYRKLRSTNPAWFTAKIAAWFEGKELGTSYLGCCCEESEEAFYRHSEYLPQMIKEAVAEADQSLLDQSMPAKTFTEVTANQWADFSSDHPVYCREDQQAHSMECVMSRTTPDFTLGTVISKVIYDLEAGTRTYWIVTA